MASHSVNSVSSRSQKFAFVTLVTTDHYLPGALVLAHSLRKAHSTSDKPAGTLTPADLANLGTAGLSNRTTSEKKIELVCLVTPASVSVRSIKTLVRYFDKVVGVEPLSFTSLAAAKANERGNTRDRHSREAKAARKVRNETRKKLALLGRPDLGEGQGAALTKLHAWRLTGYDKIIYLDADILVLRPIAHLFSITSSLAASPDIGWPDAFNTGLLVLTPSLTTFSAIREYAVQRGSWDGADQGLLNDFYGGERGSSDIGPGGGWQRLPFRYNVTPSAGYMFAPAYERYGSGIYTAHFIGRHKPWNRPKPQQNSSSNSRGQSLADHETLLCRWHSMFEECYPQIGRMQNSIADVIHTERGVEVVERPFTVPSYKAVWDLEGSSYSSGAELSLSGNSRLTKRNSQQRIRGVRPTSASFIFRGAGQAEDLKEMFTPSIVAASAAAELENLTVKANLTPNEGVYLSLPLDNRTSLMAAELDSGDEGDSSSDSDKTLQRISPPVVESQPNPFQNESSKSGEWSPPKVSWDPSRGPPPKGGGESDYQMRIPVDAFYVNAWDQSVAEQMQSRGEFVNATKQQNESQKRTLSRLQREHYFDNLGSAEPDIRKVKPVFPWEANTSSKPISRTFPEDPKSVVPGSNDMRASHEAGSVLPQDHEDSTPDNTSTELTSSNNVSDSTQARKGGFPATITYTNAWDQIDLKPKQSRRNTSGTGSHHSRAVQTQADQTNRGTQTRKDQQQQRSRTSTLEGGLPFFNGDQGGGVSGMNGGFEGIQDQNAADQSGDGDNESSSSSDEEVERDGTSWRRVGPGPGYQRKVENHQILSRSPRHGQQTLGTSPSSQRSHHNNFDFTNLTGGFGGSSVGGGSSGLLGSELNRTRSRSSSNASNGQQASVVPMYSNPPPPPTRTFRSYFNGIESQIEEGEEQQMPYEQLLSMNDQASRRRMGIRTPTSSLPGSANNSGTSSPSLTPINMSPNHSRHDLTQMLRMSNSHHNNNYNSQSRLRFSRGSSHQNNSFM